MAAGLDSAADTSDSGSASNGFRGVVKAAFRKGGAVAVLASCGLEAKRVDGGRLGVRGNARVGLLCVRFNVLWPK